jgi:nifR3 family TIM-barrel protein
MKLVLAPMASITDLPYRLLFKRHFGVDVVISELISSHGVCQGDKKTQRLCRMLPDERPVGAQIFGHESQVLARAARILEDMGYDFIDINLGCPVQKIVSKGAGAALCRDLNRLFDVLGTTQLAISIPVSIKIRLGWDEQSINAMELVARAKAQNIQWVAIHGRTRHQGYSGEANWDMLRDIARTYPGFVIGNGDIKSYRKFERETSGASFLGVMIGRAALSYPWIFHEIRQKQKIQVRMEWVVQVLQHYLDYLSTHGTEQAYVLLRLKKMAGWLSHGLPGASQFRRNLFSSAPSSPHQVLQVAETFFQTAGERFSDRSLEDIYRGGEG